MTSNLISPEKLAIQWLIEKTELEYVGEGEWRMNIGNGSYIYHPPFEIDMALRKLTDE
jgi:hypothetical protein